MFEIDKQKARGILIQELSYEPEIASLYLELFPSLDDRLAEAVSAWFDNREVLHIEVEGLTIRHIMEVQQTHFLNAVHGLNDLLTKKLTEEERDALKTLLSAPLIRASLGYRGER
ncbi:MAG: hypothetical protein ACRD2L_06300 [Terriglobia bacterium]